MVFDVDHDFEGPRAPKAHLDTIKEKVGSEKTPPLDMVLCVGRTHAVSGCVAVKLYQEVARSNSRESPISVPVADG